MRYDNRYKIWNDVLAMSREYKLVTVFKDKLEAVN